MIEKYRKYKKIFLAVAIVIIVILGIQAPWEYLVEEQPIQLNITMKTDHDDVVQLFYIMDNSTQFKEEDSIKADIKASSDLQTLVFTLPKGNIKKYRLDTGSIPGKVALRNIKLVNHRKIYEWTAIDLLKDFQTSNFITNKVIRDEILYFDVVGNDPIFESGNISAIFAEIHSDNSVFIFAWLCMIIFFLSILFIILCLYKKVLIFLKEIFVSRKLIFELAKKDLQNRYLGSYLGIIWAFVQPTITIFIFWFVFQIGFKSAPINNFPFILWLICGMIPWFFFSESLMGATNSIIDNSYLVKKVVFKVSMLPIVRILSSLFIHLFFVIIIFLMFAIYGYMPNITNIQVFYYLFALIIMELGLSWITSALIIFLRDLGQIINIIIQFGFWLTPIFWSLSIMPEKYYFLIKINPMYYIIEGYRDSFINHTWFWQHYNLTINFWIITFALFFIGALLFKKLKPHFADVL